MLYCITFIHFCLLFSLWPHFKFVIIIIYYFIYMIFPLLLLLFNFKSQVRWHYKIWSWINIQFIFSHISSNPCNFLIILNYFIFIFYPNPWFATKARKITLHVLCHYLFIPIWHYIYWGVFLYCISCNMLRSADDLYSMICRKFESTCLPLMNPFEKQM